MKNRVLTLLAFTVLILAGCSGVKNLRAPELNLPESMVPGEPLDSLTIADIGWWEFYSDSDLKEIISRTLKYNKNLLSAAERVEQARYLYNADKAKLLPELAFRLPWNNETNDYYAENKLRDPEIGVKATISWEADLWGKLRWGKRRAFAQYEASVEEERAMRMVLVAEAASAYFRLVALDNELEIVKSTMITREEGVRLAKLRYEGGLTSETVYQQAQVQYATAAALIPNLEYNIQVTENVLSLLMGAYPDEKIIRSDKLKENLIYEQLPMGLPSTLLERRPDLRVAEQQLKTSLASVGISYANRFPSLVIDITGGWENDKFQNLFKSPFSYVAENFVAPLIDFGKRKNTYKAAVAAYEQSRLNYEQKVIEAFTEVDNALSRYKNACHSVSLQKDLLQAAHKYQELTWKQYRGGTINYIDVLDAQRRYLEAQIANINAIRDEHIALIQVYKSLGGGWTLPQSLIDPIAEGDINHRDAE